MATEKQLREAIERKTILERLKAARAEQQAPIEIDRNVMVESAPINRPESAARSIIEQGGGSIVPGGDALEGIKAGFLDIGAGINQRLSEALSEPKAGGIAIDRPEADIPALTERNELQQSAEQFSQEIERRNQILDPDLQLAQVSSPVVTFLGRVAGQSIALPLAGPKVGTTVVQKVLAGGAMGGTFGGLQPTSADEDAITNALLGAASGGFFTGISEPAMHLMRKFVNASKGVLSRPEIQKVVKEAKRLNIPIFADDVVQNPFLRFASRASEEIPLVGTAPGRIAQNQAQKKATKAFLDRLALSDPDLDGVILKSLGDRVNKRKAHKNLLWERVAERTNHLGAVDLRATNAVVRRELREELARGEQATPAVVEALKKMARTKPGTFGFHTESTKPFLSENINRFYNGDSAVLGKQGVQRLQRVKEALDQDLGTFASNAGREAKQLYTRANRFTQKLNDDLRNTGLKNLVGTNEPEKIMAWLSVSGGRGSRNQTLYNTLDQKGRAAVRHAVIQDAWDAAIDNGGVFDSRVFVKAIKGRQGVVDIFFKDRDFDEINGLVNVLKVTKQASEVAAGSAGGINALGRRLLTMPGIVTLGTAGAGFTAGGTTGLAASVGLPAFATRLLTQTEKGRDLLAAAGRTTPETEAMEKIVQQMINLLNREQVVLQQEFREGDRPEQPEQ